MVSRNEAKAKAHFKVNDYAKRVIDVMNSGQDPAKISKMLQQEKERDFGVTSFDGAKASDEELFRFRKIEVAQTVLSTWGNGDDFHYKKVADAIDGIGQMGHNSPSKLAKMAQENHQKQQPKVKERTGVTFRM